MAAQTITRGELAARREILVCRACGGVVWHFDAHKAPSSESPVMLIGYRCDGCGVQVSLSVLAPAEAAEADRAGS
jgi:hypothetical protein